MTTTLRYTILAGDTLSSIANGLDEVAGVSYEDIEQANPNVSPTALSLGMLLNIPARGSSTIVLKYTVLSGDSFSSIADGLNNCNSMTYQAIEQANPTIDPNALSVGEIINIPATNSTPSTQPSKPQPITGADIVGFWWWTYAESTTAAPAATNLGIAFSGWNNPTTAISESARLKSSLPGSKYISIGGGDPDTGAFSSEILTSLNTAINNGSLDGYDGIAYDVEEGVAGLKTAFQESFATAKAKGLKVLVTVSHSAPYGITDAAVLMKSFFADSNIDFLSPQLYTEGDETANDYAITYGVTWKEYASAKAAIIPSIVDASLYEDAKTHFGGLGIEIPGFIQWSQSL